MHAHLIDPEKRTVETIEFGKSKNFLPLCYERIGKELDCRRFNDHRDYLWVDDHGFQKGTAWVFRVPTYYHPIAGLCLIVGCDEIGENQNPVVTKEWLEQNIQWLGRCATNVEWETRVEGKNEHHTAQVDIEPEN